MDKQQNHIYLDYAATTPIDSEVIKAMEPYFGARFGNPSSIHFYGQEASAAVDKARSQVADFLGAVPQEIIFTGGATESNNLALRGLVKESRKKNSEFVPHIITSTIEHDSVLETAKDLKKDGVEVSFCPVDSEGVVDLEKLKELIRPNTILVSVMYANNEIGTTESIKEIGAIIKQINESRDNKIYFHTDAVQAVQYLDCKVNALGVDLLSLSGHKIYGPKGVSALYVRNGTPIRSIVTGGGQEYEKRSGTLNVPSIVGLGQAVIEVEKSRPLTAEIKRLRDKLVEKVLKSIPDSKLNGPRNENRLPNNANFMFPGAEGESILILLDQAGIATSTGSACASKSLQPSHVLLAIGVPKENAHASLRVTLGKYTTEEDIDKVIEVLPGIISRLREIAGVKVG